MNNRGRVPNVALLFAALAFLVYCSCSRVIGSKPEKLFANAFRVGRNLELRLPGVLHARIVPAQRGESISITNPELAEAEAMILRHLETESPPISLLALQGRLHLLRSRWDLAIDSAQTVYELEPSGGDLDLGIAYLARGLAQQRPRDLQFAIEHLSVVISRSAGDTVALFNRAIAFEKLYLFRRAESDCEAYLRLDPSSGWAAEVHERLRRIREIRTNWRKKLDRFSGAEEAYLKNHTDAPAEIFLDRAIEEWLPRLRDPDSQRSSKAREALRLLAAQLSERHSDPWLSDLLAKPKPTEALRNLAAALNANRTANYDVGLQHARDARRLFDASSNFAGSARARAEEVYALSRSYHNAHDCLNAAPATFVTQARRYPWIEEQLLMERAICSFHAGDFDKALQGVERALKHIEVSGFETLYLRGLGHQAAFHTMLGNTSTAALTDWRGLELYWRGAHLPNRAYQFYSDLFMSAEREQRWRSAYAFALEAVDMVTLGSNRLTEAVARSSLGAFALRIGENTTAVQQTEMAAALLTPFSDMPSARAYRLENLIILASAYISAGRTEQAAKTLATSEFQGADSIIAELALRRTQGLVLEAQQQWNKAGEELFMAATLAGRAIRNLHDDVSRLKWKRESDLVFRALTRIAIDHEHSAETALAFWAWFRSAPFRQQAVAPTAPEDLVRLMNSRRAMYPAASIVSWAQIDQRVAIWLFDDRGVRFAWSPAPASRCKALCARFSRLCSQPGSNLLTVRNVGQELYQSLFAPVADQLTHGRVLLLEPDVLPGNIAFEALVHPDGRWLGEHFTMVTSPGFSAELALRERRTRVRRSSTALIVGNPAHTAPAPEFYSPLPDAEREAQFIRQFFSSGRSILGSAATPRAVTASLAQSELFHFAGHARFDGESARLLLAGEGASLGPKAIEEFGGSCRLAVLAACSTAGPDRDGPWNADSLVQAFWRAGTPLVIASLWEVDSRTTVRLFAEFYTRLLNGENGAESIRQAAAAVRSSPGNAHPFFWAAFHAFGCLPIDSQTQ